MAKTICAWCGDLLDGGPGAISHGLCPSCSKGLLSEQRSNLGRFLELFDDPILLIDGEREVLAGNGSLRRLLGTEDGQLENHTFGELFGCLHALPPHACGDDEPCAECAVRASVAKTLATGQGVIGAAAALSRAGGEELRLRFTTERVGEALFLRIDGIAGAAGMRKVL